MTSQGDTLNQSKGLQKTCLTLAPEGDSICIIQDSQQIYLIQRPYLHLPKCVFLLLFLQMSLKRQTETKMIHVLRFAETQKAYEYCLPAAMASLEAKIIKHLTPSFSYY